MTDSVASIDLTIGEIIEGTEPMGDVGELLIDDLTEEVEDQFFGILRRRLRITR